MTFLKLSEDEKLPEGISQDVFDSPAFQDFVKAKFDTFYKTKSDTELEAIRQTNADLKDEKRKLQGFLNEYKDAGVSIDEFKTLQAAQKGKGAMSEEMDRLKAEHTATVESLNNKIASMEGDMTTLAGKLGTERLTNYIHGAIEKHNAEYPAVRVLPGSERWLVDEAKRVFKQKELEDGSSQFTPMEGEKIMTGAEGSIMQGPEWVNHLRANPEFRNFFQQPKGGGYGDEHGEGKFYNPQDMAGSQSERASAIAAKYNLPA